MNPAPGGTTQQPVCSTVFDEPTKSEFLCLRNPDAMKNKALRKKTLYLIRVWNCKQPYLYFSCTLLIKISNPDPVWRQGMKVLTKQQAHTHGFWLFTCMIQSNLHMLLLFAKLDIWYTYNEVMECYMEYGYNKLTWWTESKYAKTYCFNTRVNCFCIHGDLELCDHIQQKICNLKKKITAKMCPFVYTRLQM